MNQRLSTCWINFVLEKHNGELVKNKKRILKIDYRVKRNKIFYYNKNERKIRFKNSIYKTKKDRK